MLRPISSLALATLCVTGCAAHDVVPTTFSSAVLSMGHRSEFLYVLDAGDGSGAVTVYSVRTGALVRTIRAGISAPTNLAVDPSGNLYVANLDAAGGKGWISVYARGTRFPMHRITNGVHVPIALKLDDANNLYVANQGTAATRATVTIYDRRSYILKRTIRRGLQGKAIFSLALDRSGSLYVGTPYSVQVFRRGQSTPSRAISDGIFVPLALAFDSAGRLYAADNQNNPPSDSRITVYGSGSHPIQTIKSGIYGCVGFQFDAAGNLYVANFGGFYGGGTTVPVYGPNQVKPERVITSAVISPSSLAMDSEGDLYVAVAGGSAGAVNVYADGGPKLSRVITDGVHYSNSLSPKIAIGP